MEIGEYIEVNNSLIMWGFLCLFFFLIFIPLFRTIRNKKMLKTVTSLKRGTKSERDLVLKLLKHKIPAQTIFHDLYIEKNNEEFSQVDIVIATTEGIIIIEVKDYSGWIFGNGNHSHWTKVLAYGKQKYQFYNPIKQNENHISAIKKQLRQFNNIPFFSIIVFYGDCELKEINYVPKNTFLVKASRIFEVLKLIRKNNEPAPYTNKNEIIKILKQAVKNGENERNQEKHVDNIEDMLGKYRIFN